MNVSSSSYLEKIATGLAINKSSDDVSSLVLDSILETQRSTVSQSLENINNGLAMSNIAQSGLKEQNNLLEKMQTLSLQASTSTINDEGRESIKKEISKYVEQFNAIAESTNYNGQQLLSENNNNLAITTDEGSQIDMSSTDTRSIGKSLDDLLNSFSQDSLSFAKLAKDSATQVSNFASQFSAAANQMESSGRTALAQQTSLAEASSAIIGVDYANEISNFSKSNIQIQLGMIASTQANAVTERNVRLLS
jgi:flagellin